MSWLDLVWARLSADIDDFGELLIEFGFGVGPPLLGIAFGLLALWLTLGPDAQHWWPVTGLVHRSIVADFYGDIVSTVLPMGVLYGFTAIVMLYRLWLEGHRVTGRRSFIVLLLCPFIVVNLVSTVNFACYVITANLHRFGGNAYNAWIAQMTDGGMGLAANWSIWAAIYCVCSIEFYFALVRYPHRDRAT